jgi:hypothetical protein
LARDARSWFNFPICFVSAAIFALIDVPDEPPLAADEPDFVSALRSTEMSPEPLPAMTNS